MSKLLDIDINEQLVEIFEQYDMDLGQMEEYLFVDGLFPGIAGQAFEMERFEDSVVVQVDITVLFPNQDFVESFVGHASSIEEAIAIALEQFQVNVVHTLIMAFWEKAKRVENGVGTDIWEINGSRWEAVISNYGYRGEEEFDSILPDIDVMFDAIQNAIKALPLEKSIYAVRTVQTNTTDGQQVTEALINNEEFSELESVISALPWSRAGSYYSVRNLVLVMKLKDPEEEEVTEA